MKALTVGAMLFLLCTSAALRPAYSQTIGFERERARTMLDAIKGDIEKHYYDPNYRGIDVKARFAKADEAIKAATTVSQIVTIIAQTLLDFKDSHTFFIPPQRQFQVRHGWQMQIIGDKCYIIAVKPGSDAEAKGLKEGDELLSVNTYKPTRNSLWILQYFYNTLSPQPKMQLVARSPEGKVRELEVLAKVEQLKSIVMGTDLFKDIREAENEAYHNRHRYYEIGTDFFIWKMPQFDMSETEIDKMMSKVKKRKAFILDLRGNGGGLETTMQRLLGHLFDHDLKIGDLKSRKEEKPVMAKTRGADNFKGELIILIDSRSASASEVVARMVQMEKRGTIIGDRSSGAVMRSRIHGHKHGQEIVLHYGASITESDLVMTDGKSLEGVGVVPDKLMLPTAADLAAKRDPVLAHAASLVGLEISAEKAGTLFPLEWKD
ncbi:MAG TPA: S41 family peptidase [Pyrinomonadaceae bacterium]